MIIYALAAVVIVLFVLVLIALGMRALGATGAPDDDYEDYEDSDDRDVDEAEQRPRRLRRPAARVDDEESDEPDEESREPRPRSRGGKRNRAGGDSARPRRSRRGRGASAEDGWEDGSDDLSDDDFWSSISDGEERPFGRREVPASPASASGDIAEEEPTPRGRRAGRRSRSEEPAAAVADTADTDTDEEPAPRGRRAKRQGASETAEPAEGVAGSEPSSPPAGSGGAIPDPNVAALASLGQENASTGGSSTDPARDASVPSSGEESLTPRNDPTTPPAGQPLTPSAGAGLPSDRYGSSWSSDRFRGETGEPSSPSRSEDPFAAGSSRPSVSHSPYDTGSYTRPSYERDHSAEKASSATSGDPLTDPSFPTSAGSIPESPIWSSLDTGSHQRLGNHPTPRSGATPASGSGSFDSGVHNRGDYYPQTGTGYPQTGTGDFPTTPPPGPPLPSDQARQPEARPWDHPGHASPPPASPPPPDLNGPSPGPAEYGYSAGLSGGPAPRGDESPGWAQPPTGQPPYAGVDYGSPGFTTGAQPAGGLPNDYRPSDAFGGDRSGSFDSGVHNRGDYYPQTGTGYPQTGTGDFPTTPPPPPPGTAPPPESGYGGYDLLGRPPNPYPAEEGNPGYPPQGPAPGYPSGYDTTPPGGRPPYRTGGGEAEEYSRPGYDPWSHDPYRYGDGTYR